MWIWALRRKNWTPVKFYNNKAGADGGVMYTNDNYNVVMKGNSVVLFNNNVALGDSGAVYSIIMNSCSVFSKTTHQRIYN